MKRHIVLFEIIARMVSLKKKEEISVGRFNHEKAKPTSTSHGAKRLDIPTYIRQGRVLSIL